MENEVKLILESLVSESFSSRIQTKPFGGGGGATNEFQSVRTLGSDHISGRNR